MSDTICRAEWDYMAGRSKGGGSPSSWLEGMERIPCSIMAAVSGGFTMQYQAIHSFKSDGKTFGAAIPFAVSSRNIFVLPAELRPMYISILLIFIYYLCSMF